MKSKTSWPGRWFSVALFVLLPSCAAIDGGVDGAVNRLVAFGSPSRDFQISRTIELDSNRYRPIDAEEIRIERAQRRDTLELNTQAAEFLEPSRAPRTVNQGD